MSDCGRDCGCRSEHISRRTLLKVGAGAAGVAAGMRRSNAAPGDIPPECRQPAPQAWFDQLTQPGETIVYRGDHLNNLIFPLGGIGTGTIWLNGRGRLVNWQIFNNIQKDSLVDDTFFAVRIEQDGMAPVTRVLQADDLGSIKGFSDISFVGRYPVANVLFKDDSLPVDVELEAFNPLVPLDEEASGIPCAIFTLRVRNRSGKRVKISLLGSLQNAIGHRGRGPSNGIHHGTYGGNFNERVADDRLRAVLMRAIPGKPAEFKPPVELLVDHTRMPLGHESPVKGLTLATVGSYVAPPSIQTVYWLAEGNLRHLGGSVLRQITEGVREYRALLLLSGMNNPLLDPVRPTVGPEERRRETLFAGFDDTSWGVWTAEGNAFKAPKSGKSAAQNPVSGWLGAGFVNSFDPDDHPQGKLISPRFVIKERYISLLVGGGQHPGACCVNLVIDGKVVRSATGKNSEQLERAEWEVADLIHQEARIEIVDSKSNPWGHILVDDIRFGNLPIDAITTEEADGWNELLADAKQGDPMSPTPVERGKVVIAPLEFGGSVEDVDAVTQRDKTLAVIAPWAGVTFTSQVGRPEDSPSFGTMCLATNDTTATTVLTWTDRDRFVSAFSDGGADALHDAAGPDRSGPSMTGKTVNAALVAARTVRPDAMAEATFYCTWHFPSQYYPQNNYQVGPDKPPMVGNMYTNWFGDALDVARRVAASHQDLRERTFAYVDGMFDTTLPQYFIDAVAANVSIIRSPTCFWTKDGTLFGFEGCVPTGGGCCPMNCNHVWNYEQSLAKLWPALERDMRKTELKYHQRDDGGTNHRVAVPRDNPAKHAPPVADGQCGAVLKAYREHLQSRDRRFLADYWPETKKAMDFAIREWDVNEDGVMEKAQFNTYDREIFGHNTFVSSLYLAALRAAEEMARLHRDEPAATRYRKLFETGRDKIAKTLFNGEYYIQDIESAIESRRAFDRARTPVGQEPPETTKQMALAGGYGIGCWSDQVVGQWWARVLDLGDILPNHQVQSALHAIYQHCFLWRTAGFEGTQRFLQFGDGDDKGLLCGAWPAGGRPDDPIYYRDEYWTGIEYQVAAHKLYEGQITEGLAIVKGARERYDGRKKSPWNEIECGDYYARALSSWSLLLAAQGYACDGPARRLTFIPRLTPTNHRSLFTTPEGWGRFEQKRAEKSQVNTLNILEGRCEVRHLRLGLPEDVTEVNATIRHNERTIHADVKRDGHVAVIDLAATVALEKRDRLQVELAWS